MEQWGLVLGDSALLLVALVGGVVTLVRMRRLRPAATVSAAIACVLLALAMIFDLVWWLVVVDAVYESGDGDSIQTYNNVGILITMLLTASAVGLLVLAANGGHPAAAVPGPPSYGQPARQQAHQQAQQPAYAQPANGWTPPQQAQPGDWNIMSGVWSIPPGTFDGPPPESNGGNPPRR